MSKSNNESVIQKVENVKYNSSTSHRSNSGKTNTRTNPNITADVTVDNIKYNGCKISTANSLKIPQKIEVVKNLEGKTVKLDDSPTSRKVSTQLRKNLDRDI